MQEQENQPKVRLSPLSKDGEKLLTALDKGNMAAILSGMEIMYVFIDKRGFECFIHPIGSEEGRHKSIPNDEPGRAVIKNLASLADQLFEVSMDEGMHYMGIMVAAEQGIVDFLDMTGNLPAEDFDFMTGETLSGKNNQ